MYRVVGDGMNNACMRGECPVICSQDLAPPAGIASQLELNRGLRDESGD